LKTGKKEPVKKVLYLRIPLSLAKKIAALATSERRSLNGQAEKMLAEHPQVTQ
jgi:hypothetical protein